VVADSTCSRCGHRLEPEDFGFLCPDCSSADSARRAAYLRQLGLPLGLAKDDAVAHANRQPELEFD
jgi:predicted RNA-binding Zn-ribbon protein involved in translation (DUF1610 family)